VEYVLNIDTNKWPLALQYAYEDHVGVTPQYARIKIARALEAADPTSNEPPDEFYNISPKWLIGLLWAGQHLSGKPIGWNQFVATLESEAEGGAIYDAIIGAFFAAIGADAEDDDGDEPVPLAETSAPSQTTNSGASADSPPTKTSSRSASRTTGAKKTSSR